MASYGSIYPTLTKLEAEGLVSCVEEIEPGKPTRKVYSLNDFGEKALIDAISEVPKGDIFKSEFMFLCLCSELLQTPHISRSIEQQIARLQDLIERLEQAGTECGHKESQFVIEYGLSINKAALNYLVNNRHKLEDRDDNIVADLSAKFRAAE